MLQLALALGAFFGVLILGAATIAAFNPRRHWRSYAALDKGAVAVPRTFPPAFEPLHMEPFTLKWPSEVGHQSTGIQELPWPSETWDDDYFGTRAREDVQRIAKTAAAIDAKRARSAQEANRLRQEHDAAEASRNTTRQQALQSSPGRSRRTGKGKKHQKHASQTAQERPQPSAMPTSPPVKPQPRPEEPPPSTQATGAPSAAEINQLVKQLGLGGAVEEIRKRTGWDFRRAAQYLADTLRNR